MPHSLEVMQILASHTQERLEVTQAQFKTEERP
jgi:hypothetical protein